MKVILFILVIQEEDVLKNLTMLLKNICTNIFKKQKRKFGIAVLGIL